MYAITKEMLEDARGAYLDGLLSHEEYYLWLADGIGVTETMLPCSVDVIREKLASDEHLNNTPMEWWDCGHEWVRRLARGLPWSMSSTVCVLKAVARRAARREV